MTDVAPRTEPVAVTIDGRRIEVPKGTLVIRAAEQLGITIPRFCDHPLLDPIGACRQCMVEVEGQRKPFTSCTTTCTPDMVVKTHLTSEVAEAAQRGQLEFLLINHPLDCPQCDKGGECPLQDQTLAHGPGLSRFIDHKRRYDKPIPISAQIALDRERCVLCARCTRFSQEISGDAFIELFERGALEQVAIYQDEPYHSYFSGNIVQICPVGALTAASYRFKARPFDLRSASSVCNQCSAGCNLRIDVRRDEIQRQLAGDNMAVNESWNCDRGRFGYEFVNSPDRLREPIMRSDVGELRPTAWHAAVRSAAQRLTGVLEAHGPQAVGVLAGQRLTDEDAYAVSRFARDVLGTDNVDSRLLPRAEEIDVLAAVAGTVGPTYDDVEHAPFVVLAGLDPEEEVPILHLRLRKAWRKHRQRTVVVGPVLGSAEPYAWRWVATEAGDEARTLADLAGSAPDAHDVHDASDAPDELAGLIEALREAGDGVVVLAGERLAASPGALAAAVGLARSLGARFAWVPRRTNARGAVDAGLVPGLLPGGRRLAAPGPVAQAWRRLPDAVGMDTRAMLQAAADGKLKALYLIGVDPVRDFEEPELARRALERCEHVIAQDLLPTDSTAFADVLLPAQASQERIGSFTNWEGRRQPFRQTVPSQGLALQDWDILRQVALVMGHDLGWETAGAVRAEAAPLFESAAGRDEPAAAGTMSASPAAAGTSPAAAGTSRPEGALTAVTIPLLLSSSASMLIDADALLATAREPRAVVNAADARRLGLRDGEVVRVTRADEPTTEGDGAAVALPLAVSEGVASGTVVLPVHGHRRDGRDGRDGTGGAGALVRGTGPLHVRLAGSGAAAPGDDGDDGDVGEDGD